MSKYLVTSIVLLIAFCTGIFFYAEWQKKQFDEALPKPPAPAVHVPAEHEHSNSGHDHEEPIPHHEETHEQTHVHEPLSTVETDEGELSVTERTTETVSNAETTPSDEVATEAEKPRRKYRPEDFNDPYKRVEMMSPALIAMNGDIPEVEEFLDLELRIATAPVYTAADRLRHAELQAQLVPHQRNDEFLEYARSLVRKYGPDALYGPEAPVAHPSHSHDESSHSH